MEELRSCPLGCNLEQPIGQLLGTHCFIIPPRHGSSTDTNKLAKLRRHASQVHFAKIHFG